MVHEDYNGLISYQSNRDYSGESWVGKSIINLMLRKKILIIEYKGFKDDQVMFEEFIPIILKQYNNRWFLFGKEESEQYTGITNLALDRIQDVTETIEDIAPNTTDWGDFFDQMIGVSVVPNQRALRFKA